MEKPLEFTVEKFEPGLMKGWYVCTINIVDEFTLQWMEKHYPGQFKFDGGRVFTLRFSIQMDDPNVKNLPAELARQFVLGRLKGTL